MGRSSKGGKLMIIQKVIIVIIGFISMFILIQAIVKHTNNKNRLELNKTLQLTDNTIVYQIGDCYIAESKTNGYVDVEISCP